MPFCHPVFCAPLNRHVGKYLSASCRARCKSIAECPWLGKITDEMGWSQSSLLRRRGAASPQGSAWPLSPRGSGPALRELRCCAHGQAEEQCLGQEMRKTKTINASLTVHSLHICHQQMNSQLPFLHSLWAQVNEKLSATSSNLILSESLSFHSQQNLWFPSWDHYVRPSLLLCLLELWSWSVRVQRKKKGINIFDGVFVVGGDLLLLFIS